MGQAGNGQSRKEMGAEVDIGERVLEGATDDDGQPRSDGTASGLRGRAEKHSTCRTKSLDNQCMSGNCNHHFSYTVKAHPQCSLS